MTEPVAPGSSSLSFTPPQEARHQKGDQSFDSTLRSANALSQPTTPEKRLPVVDRTKVHPEVLKAAEGMESLYLNYLMSVMRKTVPESDMSLNSPATKIYQGMLDQEYAATASRTGGLGLSDLIIAYLTDSGYNISQGKDTVSLDGGKKPGHELEKTASTGGTYESKLTEQQTSSSPTK